MFNCKCLISFLTRKLSYTFTQASSFNSNAFVEIRKKGSIIYFNIAIDIPVTASWQSVVIGTVNGWNNGAIENAVALNTIGNAISSVLLNIGADGTVTYITHSTTTAKDWFYGRSSVLV